MIFLCKLDDRDVDDDHVLQRHNNDYNHMLLTAELYMVFCRWWNDNLVSIECWCRKYLDNSYNVDYTDCIVDFSCIVCTC